MEPHLVPRTTVTDLLAFALDHGDNTGETVT